jgi:TetR/AcrR family transcriptional regulator
MVANKRDADRSKAAILTAAENLFASRGYDSASLADIAVAAKVSRGLPSYFFKNKEQLYTAVLKRAADDLRKRVLRRIRSRMWALPVDLLPVVAESYIDYWTEHPRFVRLLQWEVLNTRSRSLPGVFQALFQETLEALSPVIPRTSLNEFDLRQLLLSIAGMCLPFQILAPDASLEAFALVRKKHVVQLLRNAIGKS